MQTQFLQSYFNTPDDFVKETFVHVLRAGHVKASPGYRVDRRFCMGHDLIYCTSGKGYVRLNGKEHTIEKSELLWIDGRNPHAHWADSSDPWTVLWIRADGFALSRSAEELRVGGQPVFHVDASMEAVFSKLLQHCMESPLALDALLNADLSLILSLLFAERISADRRGSGDDDARAALEHVLDQMSVYFYKRWTVRELARMAKMSETSFYRYFQRATGSSPMSWIRRQRVSHAKRRLVETSASIKQISEQVGYSDPCFFSRDFKQACGVSPKNYRQQERLSAI